MTDYSRTCEWIAEILPVILKLLKRENNTI